MEIREYQEVAHSTSLNTDIHGDKVLYAALGLSDESGEVAGKFKKLFRDKNGEYDEAFKEIITKELGDVMWYVAEVCTQLKISMDYVAYQNLVKLGKRKEKGKIQGDGDNR